MKFLLGFNILIKFEKLFWKKKKKQIKIVEIKKYFLFSKKLLILIEILKLLKKLIK